MAEEQNQNQQQQQQQQNQDTNPNIFTNVTPNDVFDEILKEQFGVSVSQQHNDEPIKTDTETTPLNEIVNNDVSDVANELFKIDIVDDNNDDTGNEDENKKIAGGRVMNNVIKKLIEEEYLLPFDDDKPLEKYTQDDIIELIKANIETKTNDVAQKTIDEFVKSLPNELQILTKYALEGGNDIKSIMQLVNKVNDISSLEVGKDDEVIVRMYLENTNFGSQEEIEEQIKLLKDTNKLQDFSSKYKLKLDDMHNKIVQNEMEKLEKIKQQQKEFAEKYVSDVNKSLSDKKINDITLSNNKVNELINGLLSLQYDSISGRKTNKLGYLLEKYQFKEPNLKLVSEALWLLDNPDEYKQMLINKGKQEAETELKKALRTASNRDKTETNMEIDDETSVKKPRVIKRNNITENFFRR